MSEEDNHCKDCCCARSWEALGITEYTGKSIPEHISELQAENERLKKELEKHRWIPVAERLPELGDMYQVLRKHNQYPTTREYMETLKLWDSHDTITHWKEITKP